MGWNSNEIVTKVEYADCNVAYIWFLIKLQFCRLFLKKKNIHECYREHLQTRGRGDSVHLDTQSYRIHVIEYICIAVIYFKKCNLTLKWAHLPKPRRLTTSNGFDYETTVTDSVKLLLPGSEFWSSDIGRTDGRTESNAYEPIVHKHRCAKNDGLNFVRV